MQGFRQHLQECMEGESWLPAITGSEDAVNFLDPVQRDAANFVLSDLTDGEVLHPEVLYERVREVLMGLGYSIPPVSTRPELFGDTEGEEIFGMTRPQPPDSPEPEICYLYFAFAQDEIDFDYDVLAEIVTAQELEEILNETE